MRSHYQARNYDLALEAATRAAPYCHKKLPAAVEVSGTDGANLLIQVGKFGDPAPVTTIDADTDIDTDTQDTDELLPHVPTLSFPEIEEGIAVLRARLIIRKTYILLW